MEPRLTTDSRADSKRPVPVLLSVGSNIEQQRYITAGLEALSSQFGALSMSSVYESVAIGFDGDNFYNLVVGIQTTLGVGELSSFLKALEDENGRRRDCPRFSARTLDIDILTYGDAVGNIDGVLLPRQEILENAFVLLPLAELVPDELHPVEKLSYNTLWQGYERDQQLWPVSFIWRGGDLSPGKLLLSKGHLNKDRSPTHASKMVADDYGSATG